MFAVLFLRCAVHARGDTLKAPGADSTDMPNEAASWSPEGQNREAGPLTVSINLQSASFMRLCINDSACNESCESRHLEASHGPSKSF